MNTAQIYIVLTALTVFCTTLSLRGQDSRAYLSTVNAPNAPRVVKSYDLYLGFNVQGSSGSELTETTRQYVEVGLSKTQLIDARPHPPSVVTLYVSEELPLNNATEIYGTKIGGWVQIWVFSMGLAAVYYTDFDQGNFKIRPELGIGIQRFRFGVGYNIPTIGNDDFAAMSDFDVQAFLNYSIPFVKKIGKR